MIPGAALACQLGRQRDKRELPTPRTIGPHGGSMEEPPGRSGSSRPVGWGSAGTLTPAHPSLLRPQESCPEGFPRSCEVCQAQEDMWPRDRGLCFHRCGAPRGSRCTPWGRGLCRGRSLRLGLFRGLVPSGSLFPVSSPV